MYREREMKNNKGSRPTPQELLDIATANGGNVSLTSVYNHGRQDANRNAEERSLNLLAGLSKRKLRATALVCLPLTDRELDCLNRACIETIGELARMSMDDLRRLTNIGHGSAEAIAVKLRKIQLWD
jgi:DNA-directed RNA polymerase alpha subunit